MAGPLLDQRRKYPVFEHSECVLNEKIEESKVVRPRDPVSSYPLLLSYDSLRRLDRDVTQSTALSRASRVQNWLRDSSQVPLVNQDPLLPDDGLLPSGCSVQIESSDPQVSHPFGRDISVSRREINQESFFFLRYLVSTDFLNVIKDFAGPIKSGQGVDGPHHNLNVRSSLTRHRSFRTIEQTDQAARKKPSLEQRSKQP